MHTSIGSSTLPRKQLSELTHCTTSPFPSLFWSRQQGGWSSVVTLLAPSARQARVRKWKEEGCQRRQQLSYPCCWRAEVRGTRFATPAPLSGSWPSSRAAQGSHFWLPKIKLHMQVFNQESPKGHQMTHSAIKLGSPDAIYLPLAITAKSHKGINICNRSSVSQSTTALLNLESGMQENFPTTSRGKINSDLSLLFVLDNIFVLN